MKVNFVETHDTKHFGDVALGEVFLDAEDEDNKCVYMKIDSAIFDDNAYSLTENLKTHFGSEERVYVLKSELNVLKMI